MYLLSQRSNSLYTAERVWDGSFPSLSGIWGHSKKVAACKHGSESSPTCRAGPPWRTWSLRPVSIHVCILSCLVQSMVPCDSGPSPLDTTPSHLTPPPPPLDCHPLCVHWASASRLKGGKLLSLSISHLWSLTSLLSPLMVKTLKNRLHPWTPLSPSASQGHDAMGLPGNRSYQDCLRCQLCQEGVLLGLVLFHPVSSWWHCLLCRHCLPLPSGPQALMILLCPPQRQ